MMDLPINPLDRIRQELATAERRAQLGRARQLEQARAGLRMWNLMQRVGCGEVVRGGRAWKQEGEIK